MHTTPYRWRRTFWVATGFAVGVWLAGLVHDVILTQGGPQHYHDNLIWLLNVDFEQGVFTWASQLALVVAALVLLVIGYEREGGREDLHGKPIYWRLLGLGFILLSLDEFVGAHERFSKFLEARLPDLAATWHFLWVLPGAALCVALLIFFLPFLKSIPRALAVRMAGAGGLYLGGALGLELLGGKIMDIYSYDTLPYRLVLNIEELAEMAGTLYFIHTLMRYRGGELANH